MRIVSTELRQVFRAYTKQLRGQYAKASKGEGVRESRARGFERVDISAEAKALAAAGQNPAAQSETTAHAKPLQEPPEKPEEETEEKEKKEGEDEAESSGDDPGRTDRVER